MPAYKERKAHSLFELSMSVTYRPPGGGGGTTSFREEAGSLAEALKKITLLRELAEEAVEEAVDGEIQDGPIKR